MRCAGSEGKEDLEDLRLLDVLALAFRELTLKKGDIVYIHKEVDKNWLEGEHHGRLGIFPANYVEVSRATTSRGLVGRADGFAESGDPFNHPGPLSLELAAPSQMASFLRRKTVSSGQGPSLSLIHALRKCLLNEG